MTVSVGLKDEREVGVITTCEDIIGSTTAAGAACVTKLV